MPEDAAAPADPHAAAITDRYAAAAVASTGCDAGSCGPDLTTFGASQYAADEIGDDRVLSLGCGNPLRVADLRPGETVLDLGSGAGLDLLLSAGRVGPAGRVVGLDMTPEMVELARRNTAAAGNAEVLLGHIEQIPLPDCSVDVVVSNCVLNLSADKAAVVREIARVLRPGGRLGVSDLLADDDADPAGVAAAAASIGSGVRPLAAAEYRRLLAVAGLVDVRIEPTHDTGNGVVAAIVQAVRPAVLIRAMRAEDWPTVAEIYAEGIATGNATFETEVPSWPSWDAAHLPGHRLVAEQDATVLGWTAVLPVSSRCAYAGVVEHSVYVAGTARGRGIGRLLLTALAASTEQAGIWTIQTGIFPENEPSLALHRTAGFRILGVRERPGQLHGRWRDVVVLERRSTAVGT
jgi:L-amino acid N-acyltransferase YncA/2-polyprenyl-3-methyl-5-hydroxy-6-metoxy-1,4-benzoquinol methylase